MAHVAADRPAFRAHRDRLQAEPREGAQIGHEHLVVGMPRAGLVDVERIGVLHQEFAAAHQPEPRPHLVAEFPLDVIEVERQVLVGPHVGPENLGDHLLVGRAVQHVALVAVLDAQHLLAVGLVAPAFAPQVGRLDGRHQHLDGAGAVLLLAHDLLDLLQHPQAQRQKGINSGRLLPHHAGAQHQPVGDDFRLFRGLAQDRQEKAGQAHQRLENWAGGAEPSISSPTPLAANSIRNFKSKSGTGIIGSLVPPCFRSSWQSVRRAYHELRKRGTSRRSESGSNAKKQAYQGPGACPPKWCGARMTTRGRSS